MKAKRAHADDREKQAKEQGGGPDPAGRKGN
jgi:hypothetical protein